MEVSFEFIRTNDVTSEGTPIFKYTTFNDKGQIIDRGEVAANNKLEAMDKILGF